MELLGFAGTSLDFQFEPRQRATLYSKSIIRRKQHRVMSSCLCNKLEGAVFSFQMAGADCVLQPSMPLARGRGMQTQKPIPRCVVAGNLRGRLD